MSGIALALSGLKLLMALVLQLRETCLLRVDHYFRVKNKLPYEVVGRVTPVVIQIG